MNFSSQTKKILIFASLILVIIGIPLTVSLLQQQQNTRSKALASTTLSFSPSSSSGNPIIETVGGTTSLSVIINPGSNDVSFVQLDILFDPTKFQAGSSPFVRNTTAFPQLLSGPTVTSGKISVQLSIGSDPTKVIQTTTSAGTVNLAAIAPTSGSTQVSFGSSTTVLSLAPADGPSENVLSSTTPAYVSIAGSTYTISG